MTPEKKKGASWLSIAAPIFCLLLAIGTVLYQYLRLTNARTDLVTTRNQEKTLDQSLAATAASKGIIHTPSVPETPQEDTQFLTGLRQAAAESGIQIVKWSSSSRPAGTGGASGTATPNQKQPAALKGLTEILSDLEVFGPYDNVRAFVMRLEASPRLLNMDHVSWHRGQKDGTRLFMILTRYVSSPGAGANPGGQAAPTGTTGGSTG